MVHIAFPTEVVRPLRRSEFERLIDLGAFENERVELLYGTLVRMSPQGPPHSGIIQRLNKLLLPRLLGRAEVRIQSPLAGPEESRPEPDIALVAPGDYLEVLPESALLIIEVADSSLRTDRVVKARLYAQMGVAQYWIANLTESVVEVFADPFDGTYRKSEHKGRGERLPLLAFPDVELASDDLLLGA